MKIRIQSNTFQFAKGPLSKNAQSFSKIYHEVWSLMKVLQANLQVKDMKINYYDLYYTVLENRDD